MAKKTGDNYPTDLKGEMIFNGSIVAVAIAKLTDDLTSSQVVSELRLGFVSKLTQKRGIDVTIFNPETKVPRVYESEVIRVNPHTQVLVIDSETLKTRDPLHEAIRYAARMHVNEEH